jgi:hypothetical protein
MKDQDLRDTLESILKSLEQIYTQVNEATISAHSIRMAIAEVDPKMTIRIREQYLRLEKASKLPVEEVTAVIRGMRRLLDADGKKDVN